MEYIDNALLNENTQPDHSQLAPDSFQPTRVPSVPKTAAAASAPVSYNKPANRPPPSTAPSPRNVPISPAVTAFQPRFGTPIASETASLFRSPSPAQHQNPQQSPVILEGGISTEDLNLTPRGQSPSEEGFASKGILKRQPPSPSHPSPRALFLASPPPPHPPPFHSLFRDRQRQLFTRNWQCQLARQRRVSSRQGPQACAVVSGCQGFIH
jgi:hypothetical protein